MVLDIKVLHAHSYFLESWSRLSITHTLSVRLKEFVWSRRKTSNAVQMEVGTYCRWLADVDKNAAAQDRKAARSDRVPWLLRIYAQTYVERAVRKH